jgi:hypothetical protein
LIVDRAGIEVDNSEVPMKPKHASWMLGVAAFGMMCTLLSGDIANLDSYRDVFIYPAVGAGILSHFGALIAAFTSGNVIPSVFKRNGANGGSSSTPSS